MCKEGKFKAFITVKEKTGNSPAEFMELLSANDAKVDDETYALMQVVIDEVL